MNMENPEGWLDAGNHPSEREAARLLGTRPANAHLAAPRHSAQRNMSDAPAHVAWVQPEQDLEARMLKASRPTFAGAARVLANQPRAARKLLAQQHDVLVQDLVTNLELEARMSRASRPSFAGSAREQANQHDQDLVNDMETRMPRASLGRAVQVNPRLTLLGFNA